MVKANGKDEEKNRWLNGRHCKRYYTLSAVATVIGFKPLTFMTPDGIVSMKVKQSFGTLRLTAGRPGPSGLVIVISFLKVFQMDLFAAQYFSCLLVHIARQWTLAKEKRCGLMLSD